MFEIWYQNHHKRQPHQKTAKTYESENEHDTKHKKLVNNNFGHQLQ